MGSKGQVCLTGLNHLALYNQHYIPLCALRQGGWSRTGLSWAAVCTSLPFGGSPRGKGSSSEACWLSCTRTTWLKKTCQSVELSSFSSSALLSPPLCAHRGWWHPETLLSLTAGHASDGNFGTTHCRSCWTQKSGNFPISGAMDSSLRWNKVSVMKMMPFLMHKMKGVQQAGLNLPWLHITTRNKTKIALSTEIPCSFLGSYM